MMDNKFIKEDFILGNKKIVVGDKLHDLVLENLGKVWIKYGNSYKDFLSFITLVNTSTSDFNKIIVEPSGIQAPSRYKQGALIFDGVKKALYLKYNDELLLLLEYNDEIHEKYVNKSGDTMTGPLVINCNEAPLKVKSSELVENLNAYQLLGKTPDDFALKKKDEQIIGNWTFGGNNTYEGKNVFNKEVLFNNTLTANGESTFNGKTHFTDEVDFKKTATFKDSSLAIKVGTGDIVTDGSLGSSQFMSGMTGFGWRLDASTNTLTIDNLIVRGVLNVFELVVNKISATNGSFWITDSFKIDSLSKIVYLKAEDFYDYTNSSWIFNHTEIEFDSWFNTEDYYIPITNFVISETPDTTEHPYANRGELDPLGSSTPSFDFPEWIFRINRFDEFKNIFVVEEGETPNPSVIQYLFDIDRLASLAENDIISLSHIFQKDPKRVSDLEQIGTSEVYVHPNGIEDFSELLFTIVDSSSATLQNDGYYTFLNGALSRINLYYKYFGSNLTKGLNLYILNSEENEYPVFKPGDILKCLKFDGKNIKQYHALVLGTTGGYGFIALLQNYSILLEGVSYSYDENGLLIQSLLDVDFSLYDRSEGLNLDLAEYFTTARSILLSYKSDLQSVTSDLLHWSILVLIPEESVSVYENALLAATTLELIDLKILDIFYHQISDLSPEEIVEHPIFKKALEESVRGLPAEKDSLVRIGSIYPGDRRNSMYLTSSEGNSPYLDVMVDINRPDYTVTYLTPKYKTFEDSFLYEGIQRKGKFYVLELEFKYIMEVGDAFKQNDLEWTNVNFYNLTIPAKTYLETQYPNIISDSSILKKFERFYNTYRPYSILQSLGTENIRYGYYTLLPENLTYNQSGNIIKNNNYYFTEVESNLINKKSLSEGNVLNYIDGNDSITITIGDNDSSSDINTSSNNRTYYHNVLGILNTDLSVSSANDVSFRLDSSDSIIINKSKNPLIKLYPNLYKDIENSTQGTVSSSEINGVILTYSYYDDDTLITRTTTIPYYENSGDETDLITTLGLTNIDYLKINLLFSYRQSIIQLGFELYFISNDLYTSLYSNLAYRITGYVNPYTGDPISQKCGCLLITNKYDVIEEKNSAYVANIVPNTKLRLGNLTGIHNYTFGLNLPTGFGLYGESVYLTGNFYLNNGRSLIDIDKDILLANGNIQEIRRWMDSIESSVKATIEANSAISEAVYSGAISSNNNTVLRLGQDYSLWALGNAGIVLQNPDAAFNNDGEIDPSTVGNGDESILILGNKISFATNPTKTINNTVYYEILYTETNPIQWHYDLNDNIYEPKYLSSNTYLDVEFKKGYILNPKDPNSSLVIIERLDGQSSRDYLKYVNFIKNDIETAGISTAFTADWIDETSNNENSGLNETYLFNSHRSISNTIVDDSGTELSGTFYYVLRVKAAGMFKNGKFNSDYIEAENLVATELGYRDTSFDPTREIVSEQINHNYPVTDPDKNFVVVSGTTGKITTLGLVIKEGIIGNESGTHIKIADGVRSSPHYPNIEIKNGDTVYTKISGSSTNPGSLFSRQSKIIFNGTNTQPININIKNIYKRLVGNYVDRLNQYGQTAIIDTARNNYTQGPFSNNEIYSVYYTMPSDDYIEVDQNLWTSPATNITYYTKNSNDEYEVCNNLSAWVAGVTYYEKYNNVFNVSRLLPGQYIEFEEGRYYIKLDGECSLNNLSILGKLYYYDSNNNIVRADINELINTFNGELIVKLQLIGKLSTNPNVEVVLNLKKYEINNKLIKQNLIINIENNINNEFCTNTFDNPVVVNITTGGQYNLYFKATISFKLSLYILNYDKRNRYTNAEVPMSWDDLPSKPEPGTTLSPGNWGNYNWNIAKTPLQYIINCGFIINNVTTTLYYEDSKYAAELCANGLTIGTNSDNFSSTYLVNHILNLEQKFNGLGIKSDGSSMYNIVNDNFISNYFPILNGKIKFNIGDLRSDTDIQSILNCRYYTFEGNSLIKNNNGVSDSVYTNDGLMFIKSNELSYFLPNQINYYPQMTASGILESVSFINYSNIYDLYLISLSGYTIDTQNNEVAIEVMHQNASIPCSNSGRLVIVFGDSWNSIFNKFGYDIIVNCNNGITKNFFNENTTTNYSEFPLFVLSNCKNSNKIFLTYKGKALNSTNSPKLNVLYYIQFYTYKYSIFSDMNNNVSITNTRYDGDFDIQVMYSPKNL